MKLGQIANRDIEREGRWKWSVFLEGDTSELNGVDKVVYQLHPTFKKPVRTVTNRKTRFRINSNGWGEFMIYANVVMKNGNDVTLQHWLRLREDVETDSTDSESESGITVFLSSGLADSSMALTLSDALKARGVTVISSEDVESGSNVSESIEGMMSRADIAVGIVSDASGRWAQREIEQLVERGKQVVPVIVEGARKVVLPKILERIQSFSVGENEDMQAFSDNLADLIKKSK